MVLYCLPYAGGSEVMYYGWKKYLNPSIQIKPIELKGRGRRYDEDFYQSLNEAVYDIFVNIQDRLMYEEYAIFGHSMGSLLAYELYYLISGKDLRKPKHMFFSGYIAPSVKKESKNLHTLPDDEFMKEIIELGGTPEELIDDKELLQMILPNLRNDIKITENYAYEERENKIECDITVFNGKDDDVTLEQLMSWKSHGNSGFKIYNFEGNHFFINNNVKSITHIINNLLIY